MAQSSAYDYLLKILLVGESGVGKSCLLLRYTENSFSESFISTIGVDFKIKKVVLNDRNVKLQLWDTAGQERYRTIVASFYRGANGILLTFDVTDMNSFQKVRHWLGEIKKNAPDGTCVGLIGNKCDLEDKRVVSFKEANDFATSNGLKYVETSAKNNLHVEDAFLTLAKDCLEVLIAKNYQDVKKDKDKLNLNQQPASGGYCSSC